MSYSISVDNFGNSYVAGLTRGSLSGFTNLGGEDAFMMKFDSSGTEQWHHQLGSTALDIIYGVSVGNINDIYLTGHSNGNFDDATSLGDNDIVLVKFNSSGNKQWTATTGNTSSDAASGISINAVGDVFLTGFTHGSLEGNAHAGQSDMFLIKYSSDGMKQ